VQDGIFIPFSVTLLSRVLAENRCLLSYSKKFSVFVEPIVPYHQ
jgi:hypothetical protein